MAALLIGYGNQGRGDDGLGPLFAERIARANLPGLDVDIDYQLTVDHAMAVANADLVIFADAAMGLNEAYSLSRIEADGVTSMGSHALTPQAVLMLAATLYGREPQAHVLAIAGKEFGMVREGLSPEASTALSAAETFFIHWYGNQMPE